MRRGHAGFAGAIRSNLNSNPPRRRLADYRAVPLSLMPRSSAAEGEYEVVVIDGGDRPEHYAGLDVRGKLVLTRLMPMAVHHLAIERFGAAGLIFDGMRSVPEVCPPGDLQDDIQYASWWWWGGETRAFGFALSPRVGAELRRMIARQGAPLRVRARVRSHFADGTIETVSALIPGETDEEVLITGHLCHPAPMANDNASGAAAVMEAARALHTLIASGALPRPKRGIRFLWMPEMTGTYAYLAAHEADLPRTVAGLNLDMVGEDQDQTGSSWLLIRGSDALPSFAEPLLEALREGYFGQAHTFNGQGDFPLFRHAVVPFSNGSDHYILGDPSVGIPAPMLIQWPDRFYHTTADTLEKVSPQSLARSSALAATYAYFLAGAGAPEVAWLAREMTYRFEIRLARKLQSASTAALGGAASRQARPGSGSWHSGCDRQEAALESLRRLDPGFDPQPWRAEAAAIADAAWARSRDVLDALARAGCAGAGRAGCAARAGAALPRPSQPAAAPAPPAARAARCCPRHAAPPRRVHRPARRRGAVLGRRHAHAGRDPRPDRAGDACARSRGPGAILRAAGAAGADRAGVK